MIACGTWTDYRSKGQTDLEDYMGHQKAESQT